jgi:hypothetical protein
VQSISKLPFLSIRPVDVTAGGHFDNVNNVRKFFGTIQIKCNRAFFKHD